MTERFPSRHAGPAQSTGYLLLVVTNTWQRAVRAALLPHGLTQAQFAVLAVAGWMEHTSGPVPQVEIARGGAIDEMMTSQILRSFEARGLVARTEDKSDARARRVRLTARGRRLLAAAMPAVERADDVFFGTLRDPGAFAGALRELVPVVGVPKGGHADACAVEVAAPSGGGASSRAVAPRRARASALGSRST